MRYGRADDLIALNFRRGSSAWLKYKKKKIQVWIVSKYKIADLKSATSVNLAVP